MSMTIGQLAKLTGLTVRALHHYDAIGLLTPSQRSDSGYRLYGQADVARLFRIQALQSVGLSLAEIAAVLARDGAALPDLIAQQLASLDEQLEHTVALRNRLAQIHELLRGGGQPDIDEWAAAVELITQYGKYCSSDDIKRLIAHRNDDTDAWRELIRDWRHAMDEQWAPTHPAVESLMMRWSTLFLRKVGGDLDLAAKLKLAYAQDSGVQSRMQAQSGISPQMLEYLGAAMIHVHRAAWARHLPDVELNRLDLQGAWQSRLMPAVGALSLAIGAGDEAKVEAALILWKALLDSIVRGDETLRTKLELMLLADDQLAQLWLISDSVRHLLRGRIATRLQ